MNSNRNSVAVLSWMAMVMTAAAATWHVVPPGTPGVTPGSPYNAWTNASTNIIAVSAASLNGDVILVTNGLYELTNQIVIYNKGVTMRSWNNGELDRTNTILKGSGQHRCLYFWGSGGMMPMVAGFTMTNGNGMGVASGCADYSGGGVWVGNDDTRLGILSNCIVTGNSANQTGGGIYAHGTNVVLSKCVITGNIQTNPASGDSGGGIYIRRGTMRDCEVIGNTACRVGSRGGGGIRGYNGATITGCLCSNNFSHDNGGGVFGDYGAFVFTNNRVYGNVASNAGGGIYNTNLELGSLIADNEIVGNLSYGPAGTHGGGGIMMHNPAISGVLVSNCLFSGNTASNGPGGGCHFASDRTNQVGLIGCTFSANRTYSTPNWNGGGGMKAYGRVVFENCVISNNYSAGYWGGGVCQCQAGGLSEVRNCLITGNTSSNAGGGLGLYGASATNVVVNCSIVSNTSLGSSPGGIYLFDTYGSDIATVLNTICCSNSATSDPNWRRYGATPYTFSFGCTTPTNGLLGSNNTTNEPLFAGYANGDFRLTLHSPCINTGTNQAWMNDAVDLDGRPRLDRFIGRVDMGCYEFVPQGSLLSVR